MARQELMTSKEWVSLIGVICAAGVSVTVYAMTHFETKEDANDKRTSLERRLDRQEQLSITILQGLKIPVPPPTVGQ